MEEKTFEFKDIFLEVKNEDKNIKEEYVRLLDGISGKFVSGQLTAVMGASGAGKSTLFDVLLGRIDNSSKSYGTVLYNGRERTDSDWIHQVSYLNQDDNYYPKFSILECIMFNLDFYQPFTSKKEKLLFAEELLTRSNIYEKRHAYVDSLSGGERKRAMIALSLCADPEIIFMDEPTSGLDSHSALTLINFMKKYAVEQNKIVVISLHQPGEALFNLFDNILYLGKGGVFYDGKIQDIPQWLEDNNLSKPEGISLAEYLFELHTNNPHPPEVAESKPIIEEIIKMNRVAYNHLRGDDGLVKNGLSTLYFKPSISFIAMITLIRRYYLNVYRTKGFFLSFVAWVVIFTFLVLFVFALQFFEYIIKPLSKVSFEAETLNDLVNYAKGYFTPEMKRHASFFCFQVLSVCETFYMSAMYNFFNDREKLVEDVYGGKYSVATYFLTYLLHDLVFTSFWFSFGLGIIFWSSFRCLINYWYVVYSSVLVFCYTVNFIFLRLLLTKASDSSTMATYILSTLSILSFSAKLPLIPSLFDRIFPKSISFLKYTLCIFFVFPQYMWKAILDYKNIEAIKENINNVKGNEPYIPPPSTTLGDFSKKMNPSEAFKYMSAEKMPFWGFVTLFVISILINIGAGLYLFNRSVKASLRLKLVK